MKRNIDDARKKHNGYRNDQPERGHALMESISNAKYLLIGSGYSNHMVVVG